ncbi:MAG: glycosyltransferase [Clostridia bacterium]
MVTENKPIRILEVVDNYYPSIDGVVNVVDNYAKLLNQKGKADVEVLVPWYPKSPNNDSYKVIRSLSLSGGKYGVRLPLPMFDIKLKKYLKHNKYDLIHCHSPATLGKLAVKLAKKQNIPIIFTVHTRYHEEINRAVKSKFLQKFALNFLLSTIKKMDYLWAVSDGNRVCLHEKYNIDLPCEVMRNGTDIKDSDSVKVLEEKTKLINKLGLNKDDKILLFVGRLVLVKNIGMLFDIMKILKDKGENYKLIIIGDGDYKSNLMRKSHNLNLDDCVYFVGNISNRDKLSAYYLASQLFVFPSTFDSCPLVIKESVAMDLPLLVVKNSSSSEEVIDGHNGFVAENEPNIWADKILDIFSNTEVYNEVKNNCKKDLYQSWDDIVDNVFEKYQQIINKNK